MEHPNYYAIIPANVRYDRELKDKAKLLYGEIVSLSNKEKQCWASNQYFAELYGLSIETISRLISDLIKKGYLQRKFEYKKGTKEIEKRILIPIDDLVKGYCQNGQGGIDQKVKDNNTSINNKKENIKRKRFIKPTLEDIKEYCKQRNNNVNAKTFYDYYEANDWKDKDGKKLVSWKQKLITWERYENKNNLQSNNNYIVTEGGAVQLI